MSQNTDSTALYGTMEQGYYGSYAPENKPSSVGNPWLRLFLAFGSVAVMVAIGVLVVLKTPEPGVVDNNEKIASMSLKQPLKLKDLTPKERVQAILKRVPLIDGHNDLAFQYRVRVHNHVKSIDLSHDVNGQWGLSHTDIQRMRKGMVGGQFWSCFAVCSSQGTDAVRYSLDQLDTIKRFIKEYSNDLTFVTTAKGIEEAFQAGKIASLIGLEGGHSIDSSLGTLRMFYDLGARYMTLTHTCNTPWADSSTQDDHPQRKGNNGLTQFGKTVVKEMNRLGMMVDLAHVSHGVMMDALDTSSAPVIFSHSSAWTLCNNNRNVRDDVLQRVKENNGIVMVNFYKEFINCAPNNQSEPTLGQVADHIEYIHRLAGPDHVGIGADYDGVAYNGFPKKLKDTSHYPNLFEELVKRGWSDIDLEKLAGRNLIRVMTDVERGAEQLRSVNDPKDDLIPWTAVKDQTCRPDF